MNDLVFIKDVIYGLKHEYGQAITIKRNTQETNLTTGAVSNEVSTFAINRAIPLPLNIRATFIKTFAGQKAGYLEPGQRELLIDRSDLTEELKIHDIAVIDSKEEEVLRVDIYEFGIVAILKSS